MIRIALLADLDEPVGPDAVSEGAAFAFELSEALAESARDVGGISVDLVARRGSSRGLPLISIDPDEALPGAADPLAAFARQDASFTQLVLAGMLADYPLVHCLAPIVAPLLMIASMGARIVHTPIAAEPHPSATIPRALFGPGALRYGAPGPAVPGARALPLPIDLSRFRPAAAPGGDFIAWTGAGGERALDDARAIAAALALPLRAVGEGDPVELLQGARALLHLAGAPTPCGAVWPLRALACGAPVAAWREGGLADLVVQPELGALAPRGDTEGLAARIRELPRTSGARRQWVLARHSRRAAAAGYREIYAALHDTPG